MCLAEFLEQSDEHERAVAELKKNLEDRPGDPETCNHLGYVYAERGTELEEAVTLIRTALRADPANAAYLDSMAWAYYKLGLRDDNPPRLRAAAVLIRKAMIVNKPRKKTRPSKRVQKKRLDEKSRRSHLKRSRKTPDE